jgi:hypothetical protein
LLARFSTRQTLPDLSAFGYHNPRARVCKMEAAEFLHVVYYHATEPPVSLFLRPHTPRLIAERMLTVPQENYRVASVTAAGTDFLLVTALTQEQTNALLHAISQPR